MQPAPRQDCLAEGSDILDQCDGVTQILDISRSYFAPEAAEAIRHQVMRFMNYRIILRKTIHECDVIRFMNAPSANPSASPLRKMAFLGGRPNPL